MLRIFLIDNILLVISIFIRLIGEFSIVRLLSGNNVNVQLRKLSSNLTSLKLKQMLIIIHATRAIFHAF